MSADRNLLFGILALQMDFLSRDQLVAGMQAWVLDKQTPLAAHLERLNSMTAEQRQVLEPLVAMHIRQHGDDPQQSLASLSSAERLRQELEEIEDTEVTRSLVVLGKTRKETDPPSDLMLTTTVTLGAQTSAGTRFRILRPHARGGLGEVFVARDTELGREVALKEIQQGKSDDPDARARFTREAEITGGLEHPGIVPVYGLGAYPDGRPFYAMRFIRGKSLHDAIKAYHSKEKTNPTEQNLELRRLLQRFIDVCEAIDYAHSRGVLHRDLKPGNIMLGRYGETLVVDWGLAKAVGHVSNPSAPKSEEPTDAAPSQLPEPPLVPGSHGSSEATQLGSALGTIAYMSPEQANGRWDQLSPASDVFSLGATLFHLLTGRPPYTGTQSEAYTQAQRGEYPRPRSLARNIPVPLEAICLKALAVRPSDRYPTAQSIAHDLERYLADEPIDALPDSVISRASRWTRHHRHWMQAGSVALLLVTVIAIGAYFYQRETALQNKKLAEEKGKLAEEKGKLAFDKNKLAEETNAKAEALRAALAQNYFAHGIDEYAAGRLGQGILDLQRALSMLPPTDPLRPHYERVLLDRVWQGGWPCLILRHEDDIQAVAFSPQGDRIVTASRDHTARIWDATTGAPLGAPMRHESWVNAVAFSPQGDRVITGSVDHTARIWDARIGMPLGNPLPHDDDVSAVAVSPQGDRVLTGSLDNTARLWDAQTGALLIDPLRHDDGVVAVAFSPHGDVLLTGSWDKTARLWDARTGAPIGEPMRHEHDVFAVAFNPRGNLVLTGSGWDVANGPARLWDAQTGAPVGQQLRHDHGVHAVAFSPSGDRVLTGAFDETARLWDASTGVPSGEPLRHDGVTAVAFSLQGDRILTGTPMGTAWLWDAHAGVPLGEPRRHEESIKAVAFSPQGDSVITGSDDGTARIWDARPFAPFWEKRIGAPRDEVRDQNHIAKMAFSPQMHRVLTVTDDGIARLWDTRTGTKLGQSLRHDGRVNAIAFSPQGDKVVTGGQDHTARLWNAETGAPHGQPLRHDDSVDAVAFSPQGDRIITGSWDATARLWDVGTGALIGEPLPHEGGVTAVGFSPRGDRISTGTHNFARLWDANTRAVLSEPLPHKDLVSGVAFSPNGDRLITCGFQFAQIWDARTGAPLGDAMRGSSNVDAMAFNPAGDSVVIASGMGAQIWDARTGAQLGKPLSDDAGILAVGFSPNGFDVFTGSRDGIIRRWDVSNARLNGVSDYAALVTGYEVDREGNTRKLETEELEKRRIQFFANEAEWILALRKRAEEVRQRFLGQQLKKALEESDLFVTYQTARWLPALELAKIEAKDLKTPAMQVLLGWFRDGKLDGVAGALMGAEGTPGSGKAEVLKALKEAIPVLYWVTDERLAGLAKALGGEAGAK